MICTAAARWMTPSVSGCYPITPTRRPNGNGAAAPICGSCESAAEIAAWAHRVNEEPEQHTPMARDLARAIGPMAHASALRAEIEEAEPDDAYASRQRADFESHMRWGPSGLPVPRPSHRPVSCQATRRHPSKSRRRDRERP